MPDKQENATEQNAAKEVTPAIREGRVLSAKNRDLIDAAIKQSREAIDALQALLEETAPTPPEERAEMINSLRSVRMIAEDATTVTVAGYGMIWGGRDMYGTFFTPRTDRWEGRITDAPLVFFDHAQDTALKRTELGKAKEQRPDSIGLWVAAQLYKHQEYLAAIQELLAQGALGWSSGSVQHLVEIDKESGEILSWPVVEYSLTPCPAEPRTLGVRELRSLAMVAPAVEAFIPKAESEAGTVAQQPEAASPSAGNAAATRSTEPVNISQISQKENRAMDEQKNVSAPAPTIDVEAIARNAAEAAVKATFERLEKEPVTTGAHKTASVEVTRNPEPPAFRSLGEYLQTVMRSSGGHGVDPRLMATRATGMSEGVTADGGFLLQPTYANTLLEKTYSVGAVITRCFNGLKIGPNSNSLKVPYVNETSRANGSRWGGVQAYWLAEAGTKTSSKPALGQLELNLKKVIALLYATDELLQDATALEAFVNRIYPTELRYKVEDGVINGTGAGQPLGIMNAPALITVAKEAGQAAATLVYQNVLKMWSRLWAPSRTNAVWFISQDVEPQLYQMSLAVGTGGAPVYLPAGGLSQSPYSTLFGRPVIPTEYNATLGTTGDIILADLGEYALVDRGGMTSDSSIHVNFIYDETAFRWVYRVDGQPMWASALTPKNGGSTQSPFVALATRA